MTYYNANVYRDSPTEWAHDDCLPADQFDVYVYPDGYEHRQQKSPWNWSPIYGAPKPCKYCNEDVA